LKCVAEVCRPQVQMTRPLECMWPTSEDPRARAVFAEAGARAVVGGCVGSFGTGRGRSRPVVGIAAVGVPSCSSVGEAGSVCHRNSSVAEAAVEAQYGQRGCSRAAAAEGVCTDAWLDPGRSSAVVGVLAGRRQYAPFHADLERAHLLLLATAEDMASPGCPGPVV
jgi:hypothetical protein